jgi:hypothetical protein
VIGRAAASCSRASTCALLSLVTGCAGSLHQVAPDRPHGVVQLLFEHESREFLYETQVRLDGHEPEAVRSGDRIRLRPGAHSVELIAIAHAYGLGDQIVSQPGGCMDPRCNYLSTRSEQRTGLVETAAIPCQQQLDLTVEAGSERVLVLDVAPDNSCMLHVVPGASGRVP